MKVFPILILCQCLFSNTLFTQELPIMKAGGPVDMTSRHACLSESKRHDIKSRLKARIKEIRKGDDFRFKSNRTVSFDWPLRMIPNQQFLNYSTIFNYVDHNPNVGPDSFNQFSGSNLDYNCGNRSYDTDSGYNHRGVDIALWPFQWYMYENNIVEVVAAEAGTIIDVDDGNFDRNCSCSGNWNAIYIMHADGSVAWYAHMKSNAFTSKSIGETVEKGEFLGVVASSGCSTDVHLHFEVYNASDELIDPYGGPCNSLNNSSWWSDQEPYNNSTLNAMTTHSALPTFGCRSEEQTHFANCFNPGDPIYTAFYYRSQQAGDITDMRLRNPDNIIWQSWSHTSPASYLLSWWNWVWVLPPSGPFGTWTLEADYKGETFTYEFSYGEEQCSCPLSYAYANGTNLTGNQTSDVIYESFGWIESNQFIDGNVSVTYDSGTLIRLGAGFEITLGSEFVAYIEGCGN